MATMTTATMGARRATASTPYGSPMSPHATARTNPSRRWGWRIRLTKNSQSGRGQVGQKPLTFVRTHRGSLPEAVRKTSQSIFLLSACRDR